MEFTRREFGKLTLAGLPAAALLGKPATLAAAQARPNSNINGVQIGTITYSYGSMPEQTAEATLKYILASGISAVELMGGPIESYLGAPGRGGRGGARAGGAAGAPAGAAGAAAAGGRAGGGGRGPAFGALGRGAADPATMTLSYNGQPCAPAFDAGGPPNRGGGGGGARGGQQQTPEQIAAAQEAADARRKWMQSISMDRVRELRKMYNDAGVSIYAIKMLNTGMSDDDVDTILQIAVALGANHTTLELTNDEAQLKRLGDMAARRKLYTAYHTHTQGTMTAFDRALAISPGNMANVDFGHFVAGGGNPLDFLNKFHGRISSFHLKDRTTPNHCALNLPWGQGETPIREILQTVRKNKWTIPATIELEYQIPAGSDAPTEVRKCLDYCRQALTS